MEGEDYLLTSAEVFMAMVGFVALLVVLRRKDDDRAEVVDRLIVTNMIERGLVGMVLSFLPILMHGLGLQPRGIWGISSGALTLYIVSLAVRSNRRVHLLPVMQAHPALFRALMAIGLVVMGLQAVHAIGLGLSQDVWWFALGLTWLMSAVAYLFFLCVAEWATHD